MRILVTGSSGHLGEALVRTLKEQRHDIVSVDVLDARYTSHTGSIADRAFVARCMTGVDVVFHAATLHKPHVATHTRQDFVDTNISGTLNLLEEARNAGVSAFVFTSTTSTLGHALSPPADAPAVWVTEEVTPQPKNIYGVTKLAAESLCALFHQKYALPCLILRTSRFFPEDDDSEAVRNAYAAANAKVNEFLYRRVDIEDVVAAHLLAMEHAQTIGFGCYIISATSPFTRKDLIGLRRDAPKVVSRYVAFVQEYERRNWRMFPSIDRVYVNDLARAELGWRPRYDFQSILNRLRLGEDPMSPLARMVGVKGYHADEFDKGPYPVE